MYCSAVWSTSTFKWSWVVKMYCRLVVLFGLLQFSGCDTIVSKDDIFRCSFLLIYNSLIDFDIKIKLLHCNLYDKIYLLVRHVSFSPSMYHLVCWEWSESDACFCLQVVNILPLRGGPPPKFSQRTQLITDNYQVVWLPDKRHDSTWTASYWWASISFFCSNGFFPCDKVISFQSSYDW